MEMFLTLVLQVVLAVVVAKLTLAGSRSQKWWERKEELYSSLIEKLYDIVNFNSEFIEDHGYFRTQPPSPEERAQSEAKWKELGEKNSAANAEVEKLIHIGTFRISDEVHVALSEFKKAEGEVMARYHPYIVLEYDNYDGYDPISAAEIICDAAKKCIKSVREHAKDDLGQNSRFGRLKRKVQSLLSE